jgi:hypothetical protein
VSANVVPQSSTLSAVVKSRNDAVPVGCVVVVTAGLVVVVVELAGGLVVVDDDVVGPAHVHDSVHCEPSGHVNDPDGELGSQASPGSRTPLPHPGAIVVVVVLPLGTQVHEAASQVQPGGHTNDPAGELMSHSSPGSRTPLPHVPPAVVLVVRATVVVVVVVVDVSHVLVVPPSQVHDAVHVVPLGHANAPPGELGSHGSPGSTTPLPHFMGPLQVHADVHVVPVGHVNAPPGELGSHGSPGSTTPLPHVPGIVVVVEPPPGLHSLGYGPAPGMPRRATHSALNDATQSTQSTRLERSVIDAPHSLPDGTVTSGHWSTKPIVAGVRSSDAPQALSAPPQALQMT